ncbi:MAG TPA: hypothetical protein VFU63_01300, partial [Ktedonobacterales bacterium]|nr:hypothetical protein [Ktedonobacterales bacterium]
MQAGGSGGPRVSRAPQSSQASPVSQAPKASQTAQTPEKSRRQTGASASGSQPTHTASQHGLPDLSGHAPRQASRVSSAAVSDKPQPQQPPAQPAPAASSAQPDQPRTLDVTGKPARARETGSPSLPPRSGPTLTQKMRKLDPPDVARQVLDEQKMLAQDLLTLPEVLETSGLAKTHQRSY